MTLKKRLAGLACSAAMAAAGVCTPARAEVPQALTADGARAYAAACDATERGDFIDAQMQTTAVKDPSLLGYLSFRELMHPTAHVAAFDELSSWLAKFRDLPVADRIFALASKRKTDPAAEAVRPLIALSDGPSAANPTLSEKARRGRAAFYAGDADQASLPPSDDPVGQLLLAAYKAPADASSVDVGRFVASDPRAHRAAALAQIGRGSDAIQELRAGMALARTPAEQQNWKALTLAMGASLADRASPPKGYDLDYPTPDLQPRNGFTLDKALVYALVRQESRFNPHAVSPIGATG